MNFFWKVVIFFFNLRFIIRQKNINSSLYNNSSNQFCVNVFLKITFLFEFSIEGNKRRSQVMNMFPVLPAHHIAICCSYTYFFLCVCVCILHSEIWSLLSRNILSYILISKHSSTLP